MAHELLEPIFEADPASPYFFHGRLLSADDLRAEQQVQRAGHRRLGRAVGPGVVEGLEVESQPRIPVDAGTTAVHVRAGLALNAKGQALELTRGVDVALVLPDGPGPRSGPGLFDVCEPVSSAQLATGTGFYVLALTPAEELSAERAPKSGPGVEGRVLGCGSRYVLEGVQFRLVELRFEGFDDVPPELTTAPANAEQRSRRRNVVAHLLFGTPRLAGFAADPFARVPGDAESSVLLAPDPLRDLDDCDVPLALLEWTGAGLADVDLWAVRRRPSGPLASRRWPILAGHRARAVAEAVFLQFQAHFEKLVAAGAPAVLDARRYFRYLPPAGFLPLVQGLTAEAFFAALGVRRPRDPFRDGRRIAALVRQSFAYPPIDADLDEPVWIFRPEAAEPYVAFSASHMGVNRILGVLEEHHARLNALEPSELVITGFVPQKGPYRIGDVLEVQGRNFQFSIGATRVFLNAVRVFNLSGSPGDDRLVFEIPPVPGVSEPGTEVALRAENQREQVTVPIVLLPREQELFGDVGLEHVDVDPATIEAGAPATFRYRITSAASAAADFLLAPTIGGDVASDLWESLLEVLDDDLESLPERTIHLEQGEEKVFFVRLTEVPAVAEGTVFELTVGATAGAVSGSSGAATFTVGEEVVPPDPNITLVPDGGENGAVLAGNTVTLRTGFPGQVRFDARFRAPGRYVLTLNPSTTALGWQITRFFLTPAFYDVEESDLEPTGEVVQAPRINLTALPGANPQTSVEVVYQEENATALRAYTLELRVGAT